MLPHMSKPNGLFSEKAMETINSPEQLNQHIKITRPGYWAGAIGSLALVCAFLYWSFFGNITDSGKFSGIIFPQSGVTAITAKCDGVPTALFVKEGDRVDAGDVIWVMQNDAIIAELSRLRAAFAAADESGMEELNRQINRLIFEYEDTSVIRAEVSGIVQHVAPGHVAVSKGDPVVTIINEDIFTNDRELVAYVPMAIAGKFKIGMEAQVSPVYAPREEYGFIRGYITQVGIVPVTQENILKKFGNLEYSKDLMTEDNVIELRVTLAMDNNSENLFSWSNEKGNSLTVNTGTVCNVLVVFREFHPIELLFQ